MERTNELKVTQNHSSNCPRFGNIGHICHGGDGNGLDDSYPKLALQYASHLAKAMQGYRNGNRKKPIMAPMTAALSDQDIEDLAAYYETMSGLVDLSNR